MLLEKQSPLRSSVVYRTSKNQFYLSQELELTFPKDLLPLRKAPTLKPTERKMVTGRGLGLW